MCLRLPAMASIQLLCILTMQHLPSSFTHHISANTVYWHNFGNVFLIATPRVPFEKQGRLEPEKLSLCHHWVWCSKINLCIFLATVLWQDRLGYDTNKFWNLSGLTCKFYFLPFLISVAGWKQDSASSNHSGIRAGGASCHLKYRQSQSRRGRWMWWETDL